MQIEPPDDIELELIETTEDDVVVDTEPAVQATAVGDTLDLTFSGELWYWRGPSPFHFITVPADGTRAIKGVAAEITYGWGMIPATIRIGDSVWATALWPKDSSYVVPIKDKFRKAERLELGDTVEIQVIVRH